jgi:hypothetical protein
MPPAKTTFADQDLPFDPALQMGPVSNPSKSKMLNGDLAEYAHSGDADDEDEADVSHDSVDEVSKAAWLANREESRRWLDDNYGPRSSTPPRYESAANHPLSRHGYGNVNGVDKMETDP